MAGMLSGLSTWFFSQQQQPENHQKENLSTKDQKVPAGACDNMGFCSRTLDGGRPSTSSNVIRKQHHSYNKSSAGVKFHGGGHDHFVTRIVDCHCDIDDETDDESDYTLNDDEWVWVCSRKEKLPPVRARMCNYSWYKIDDQLDVNTISIHNEWQIEPPSCFTRTSVPEMERLANRVAQCGEDLQQRDAPSINEVSLFENLLIEHPSMSIYDQFPERRSSLENSPVKKDVSRVANDVCEKNSAKATHPQPRQGLRSIENNILLNRPSFPYGQRTLTNVHRPAKPKTLPFDIENHRLRVSRSPIFDSASSPPPRYEDAVGNAVQLVIVNQSVPLAGGDWSAASDFTCDDELLPNQNRRRRVAHQSHYNRGGKKSGAHDWSKRVPFENIASAEKEEKLMSLSDCLKNVYQKFI